MSILLFFHIKEQYIKLSLSAMDDAASDGIFFLIKSSHRHDPYFINVVANCSLVCYHNLDEMIVPLKPRGWI